MAIWKNTLKASSETYAAETDNQLATISRVTWVGAVINILLTTLKALAGFSVGSRALVADAIHSLSDLVTDAAILIGVRFWTAPADHSHPYGHQKIETIVTLVIGLALIAVGFGLGYESAVSLFRNFSGKAEPPALTARGALLWLGLSAALVSIVSKEALYRWTLKKGREIGSSALAANAWHHRSDAFSSIPTVISIGGSIIGLNFGYNLWFLDPICAIVVCLMLLKAAADIIKPTFSVLIDASADKELCGAIEDTVLSTPGIVAAHKIRTRYICEDSVAVDLHILVDGALTVTQGHDLAVEVKCKILNLRLDGLVTKAIDVIVHVEPAEDEAA